MLRDAGIDSRRVLRRAALPADTLNQRSRIPIVDYFAFWNGLEAEASDPTLALRIGTSISAESFDPPIFAALCSNDLNAALARIARYKPLIGPLRLDIRADESTTALTIHTPAGTPEAMLLTELVFFVQLARMATRENIIPRSVRIPVMPKNPQPFEAYFGNRIERSPSLGLSFAAADARLPFLTANDAMWRCFEPDLRRRLEELSENASTEERIRATLLQLLPGAAPALADVCKSLGVSTRTLQRQLRREGTTYQQVLSQTRQQLAHHYLGSTSLPSSEISFLLGYEDPNCFIRAYRGWTGTTPGAARKAG